MLFAARVDAQSPAAPPLRVQLMWYHQAQFAGYYVAQFDNYFREEGVGVELLEGGADIDPLVRLARGDVDVAVSWLDNALVADVNGAQLVNVAQIFSGSSQEVVCRMSSGIKSIRDLAKTTIGVSWQGDRETILAMLRAAGVDGSKIHWTQRSDHGEGFVSGRVPCLSGVSYNEPLWVVDAGVPAEDLVTFSARDFGVPHVEDGLYVRAESLGSREFRDRLVRFLRGLKRGWAYARAEPAPATNIVLHYTGESSTSFRHQKAMLDNVLPLMAENPETFGAIDIRAYDETVGALGGSRSKDLSASPIWTLSVVEEVNARANAGHWLRESTRQYLHRLVASGWFQACVFAGIWIFGFAGGLWATEAGYNLVGRTVISGVGCMGGGVLRDWLLGGERLPFPWLQDPLLPAGVLCTVIAASLLAALLPMGTHSRTFQWTKSIAEDLGYASLAAFGAVVPLSLGLPWVWAPFCAWLTCSGGSLVRDVLTGREPRSFRANVLDECTLLGGCWLSAGLWLANGFEHTRWLVTAALATTVVLVGGLRYFWRNNEVWYPRWLHLR